MELLPRDIMVAILLLLKRRRHIGRIERVCKAWLRISRSDRRELILKEEGHAPFDLFARYPNVTIYKGNPLALRYVLIQPTVKVFTYRLKVNARPCLPLIMSLIHGYYRFDLAAKLDIEFTLGDRRQSPSLFFKDEMFGPLSFDDDYTNYIALIGRRARVRLTGVEIFSILPAEEVINDLTGRTDVAEVTRLIQQVSRNDVKTMTIIVSPTLLDVVKQRVGDIPPHVRIVSPVD